MKYFIDTEFYEVPNTIDLISIGIVAEDGREYYALNKDVNVKMAWKDEWLRKNVLLPIYEETFSGDIKSTYPFSFYTMGVVFRSGKHTHDIAQDIKEFCHGDEIEFYGYYADYDWVVFCWLFGRMIDLPEGFPMYCKDLKQMMDDKGLDKDWKCMNCPDPEGEHNALVDAKWNFKLYNQLSNYK